MSSTDTNSKASSKPVPSHNTDVNLNGRAPDGPSIAFSSVVSLLGHDKPIPFDDRKFRARMQENGTGWEVEVKKRFGRPNEATRLAVEWTLDGKEYGHEYAERLNGTPGYFKVANSECVARALAEAAPGQPARVHLILLPD